MIPVLYAANETVFTHNGIGLLADAIQCDVTEERNGILEAVIQYPITGIQYASILEDCIVKIKPNELSEPQLFRIYKTSKPIDGIVTINLEHISYVLNGNPVAVFSVTNAGATAAIQAALNGATFAHGFSAWSDIVSLHSAVMTVPSSVRAILGGVEGSILDTWGGEYEFDNFVVKLHAARGTATDIVIEYGKNLTDLKQERNIGNVYTNLFPYAKYITKSTVNGVEIETEHLITLTEKTIAAPTAANYGHSKALIRDFSADFERDTVITESALRGIATAYLAANPIDTPAVNITVSFVQLWQTAEYANIATLERVKLCDTVTVRFAKLGVSATAKVIKTVYDSLLERYKSIELGTAKSNFAETVNNQQTQINQLHNTVKTATGNLYQAILNATAAITGQTGGYVVFNPAENPQEILIMNTASIATATKVWRWNSAGLGYSSTGYNGTYGTAITMDGAIVADFISTGSLIANLIKAGKIESVDGKTYFDLDNSNIVIDKGEVAGWKIEDNSMYHEGAGAGAYETLAISNKSTHNYRIVAGAYSGGNYTGYKFAVMKDGTVYMLKGEVGGFTITENQVYSQGTVLGTRAGLHKSDVNGDFSFFAGGYNYGADAHIYANIIVISHDDTYVVFETGSWSGGWHSIDVFNAAGGYVYNAEITDAGSYNYDTWMLQLLNRHQFRIAATYNPEISTGVLRVFPRFWVDQDGDVNTNCVNFVFGTQRAGRMCVPDGYNSPYFYGANGKLTFGTADANDTESNVLFIEYANGTDSNDGYKVRVYGKLECSNGLNTGTNGYEYRSTGIYSNNVKVWPV